MTSTPARRIPAHREQMAAALKLEATAQRAALAGDQEAAQHAFLAASERYRASWDSAPPGSYGRLIGMLKATILGGGSGDREAAYVREQLAGEDSPAACYARAIAALIEGEDDLARRLAARMRGGSDAFERTADALLALADGDAESYRSALEAIVHDFESRTEHLTGVAIADTALMLDRLARRRDMAITVESPLFPAY